MIIARNAPAIGQHKPAGWPIWKKAKELWVRLGLRNPDFPAEDMTCHGCVPDKQYAYTESRACVGAKAIENCGLCEEYPCTLIGAAFDKSEKLKSRAYRIRTKEEMYLLPKAFFSKKECLDRIHKNIEESRKCKPRD